MATTKKTSNLGQPVNSTGKSSGNTKEKDISFSDPAKEAWLRTLYSTGSYEQADSAAYSTNHTSGAPLAPVESTSSRLYQNMQNGSVERRADGRYYVTSPTTQTATRTPTAAESYADRLLSTTAANSATGMQDRWAGLSRDFGEDALENAFKQSGLSREEFYQQAVEKDRVNNSKNIGLNLETGLGKTATRVAEAAGLIKAYLKNGGDTESEGYKASADRINNLIAEANQRQNERASERIYNQAAGEITLDYAKQHRWDDAAQAAALDPNKIAEGKRMVQAAAEENARKVSEYEATFEEPRDSSWLRSRILENSNAARKLNEWSESHDFNKSLVNREEYLPKDGWTEEEENLHAYLYATDKALADEYAADINDRINAGKAKEKLASVTDDGVSAGEWVKAQAAKLLTIPETIERKFEYAATGRVNVPETPTLMQYAEAVDQAISDKLNGYDSTTGEYTKTLRDDIPVIGGKGVGDLYQLGMSILQSTAAGLTGPMGTTAIFYSSAAESAYQQALERGATYGQALVYADMNGIFEGLFEALSIDKIKGLANAAADTGSFRKLLKAAGASFLIEGSEEINTSMADLLADAFVMQGKSEAVQNIESMMAQGMSYEEAYKQNLKNTVNSLLYDGLAGGISGAAHTALFGGTRNVANAVMPYGAENTQQLLETARAREAEGYPVIGLAGAEQQVANRQARYDARGNSRKASLTRREAQNLERSFLDTYGGAEGYVRAIAEEARTEQTERQAEAEKTAARRKAGLGEDSSYSVNKGDATISVLNSDEAGNDIDGETTDFRITGMARENGRNVVRFVNENGETESVAVEDAGEAIGGDAGRFIRRLNAELGEYAPGAYELYEGGQDVDDYITLMDRAINLYAKNGADVRNITQGVMAETLTPAQLLFAQSAGNRLNTAERAEANRTAAELKQAVASAREASDFVALSRTRRQIEGYIKSLKQTRQQLTTALAGLETGTDEYNSISARIRALDAKIASNESLLEGVKEDIADAQKREHKGKKGSVSLNGGIVGTSQLAPVKSELSNKQKAAVEMAEALADALPIRFTFFEGDAKDTQGLFIETGEIFVNINSGMAINKVLAASTISHELTHFIRQNSPADYIELRDYLVGKFVEQNGQEKFDGLISGRVREVMSEGVSADEAYDRAVEEFVCNACEDMLMDSKAVQRLAYENMSLFEKVKKWVEQTIAKIKAAYEDLDTFRAEAVFGRTLDGLQEIWDNALVNATRNFNATTGRTRAQASVNENAAPESDVKFQVWDDKNGIEGFSDKAREAIELRGNAIAEDETELAYHVSRALTTKEQQTVYIGGIKDSVIDKIEGEIGRSIRKKPGQYVYGITYDSIRHLREHFDSNDKIREAINRLASMLTDHDTIESLRRGDKLIINLEKAISGRNYLSVNIAATNKRALDIHTVYITGSEKNRSLSAGDTSTSAKVGASASANNIAQQNGQGKTKYQAWDEDHPELVAVHNKSVNGVRRMLARNGVPFPSIAIKKAGTNHVGFGDVSIVFPRSSIDPAVSRYNRLYSNDAWTPTEPPIEYDVGDTSSYQKRFRDLIGKDVYDALRLGGELEERNLEDNLRFLEGDITNLLMSYDGIRYAYLKRKGESIDIPQRQKSLDGFGRYKNDKLLKIFNAIDSETILNAEYGDTELKQRIAAILNADIEREITEKLKGDEKEKVSRMLKQKPLYKADEINIVPIQDALRTYQKNGNTIPAEVDGTELRRALHEGEYLKLDEDEDFRRWVQNEFKDLVKDTGIPNGKGIYTDSGNRRSFKARHVEATLDNIVKIMRSQEEKGVGVGQINLRGAATEAYKTVEEMRAESGRLLGEHIADDVYDSYMSGFFNRLYDITERAQKNKQEDSFSDSTKDVLLEAVRDSSSRASMGRILQRNANWINYTESIADDLWQLKQDVRNMPAPYFEAKPRRVVTPEEALAYIMPDNADPDVVDELKRRGLNVLTYEANNDEDRLAKLNSVEGARFQKWSEDQFSLFDEETGRLHPELQRRIDEAEKLKEDLKRFFSGGDYSEYGITDEMIEDSLDINLYASAGESDADVDNVFMALNEISKDIGRDEREKVYELMRGLTRHMKASQAARWQGYGNRNDKAPNEGFADWNRAKDGFVNFGRTRAASSSMLSDEERAYMEREFNAILNDESASAELKEDARRNLKRLKNRDAVWYQKWEDGQELFDMVDELADVKSAEYQKWSEDTGDTAKEAANRDRAFATMKAENESLRDIVNSLRAELKESTKLQNRAEAKLERAERQTRRTEVPEVRLDDAKKIARNLIKRFESGTDANDIAARIKELGDYIVSVTGETVDYDTVKSMARDIAYEVLSDVNVPLERENLDLDDRQAIASTIKGRRFTVMQQDKGELDVEGGYNDFRKKNFGKFTLVNEGGESIDSAYTELQNTYGTVYFPEVNSPGEMIMIMADLVDNAEPVMGNPYEDYMAEATEQAANDIIYDAIGETLGQMPETLADKLAKAKAVSRAELRAARNAAKEDRSAAVAKERAAARARYEALQERSAKRIAEIKAEGKARVQEVRAHEKAEKWKKVKSIHDYYLEKEERAREARNEAASVTQYKERIIRKATNLMDRVTANTGKKHVPEALRAPLAEFLSTIRFDSKRSLAGGPETQNDLAMAERMSDLADVLAQQKNYQDGAQDAADIMGAYLDLPDGIIEQMRDIARNARDYIRRAGGDYTINSMNSLELRALDQTLDVITAAVNGLNRFHENNVYNHVDEAGASTIRELGELPEISARLRAEAKRRGLSEKDISDFLSWDNTVPIYAFKRYGKAGEAMFDEIIRGWGKMAVNAEKVIEFAKSAYSEEEAKAWLEEKKALTYIDAAGEPVSVEMSVSELMTLYELLKRNQARQHIFGGGIQVPETSSDLYAVDGRIIAELEQVLTQRQKDVADALQKYMQNDGGRLGNEVTRARWGISSFGEEHYFPIESVSSVRNADGQEAAPMRSQDLYRLMNMGFTKSLNKYANNAVVIRPIFDVFANHMADMVKYNALTMPMLDAMKWYNYRERTDVEGSGTAFLTDSVQRSIERAYGKGANGYYINFMKDMNGVNEGGRGEGRLKGLISNYKVAQIGFNLRVVMQQPTSIARAALNINPKYLLEGAVTKGDREEMMKHSGLAVWKIGLGFYDVNINSSMRQQIKHADSLKDKVQNASTWAAGKGDEITWAAMWRACKAEQRDLGYTGEELIARTADRFDHLMLSTQVMDSTISRSQNMRSTTIAMSEYTGFMSEPTMSYNTLLDAYMDFRGEMRKKGFDAAMKSRGGRMIKAVLVWQISEAIVSAVAAIADVARDDDEYETFLQKWLEHFADNYKDGANPLNLLPIVSDAYELIRYRLTQKGYSNDDTMATAGLKKFLTFLKDAAKMITGEGTGKKTPWGVIYEGLQAGGMLSGIPAAPVAREVTALHNGFVTIYNDTLGIEYDDRLNYWKTYDEGEKAAIKSAVENGYLDDEAAANALVEADAYDSTEKASQAVYEWSVKAEGYDSKYGKLYEAVMAGDDSTVSSVKSELQSHGYTDEQINGTIKQNIEEWYTDPATQFDRQQALNALTRYAGMEYADADSKLSYWFYKSETPNCGNTQKTLGPALRTSESRGIITRAEARKIWQGCNLGWTKNYDEWLSEN